MTTNVRDAKSGLLATDSRWTWSFQVNGESFTKFLDNTGYEKLMVAKSHVFMFAGSALVIDKWKSNIKISEHGSGAVPWKQLPTNGIAISIVSMHSGIVKYEQGHDIKIGIDDASFAGSGSYAAAQCWSVNKCALKAVESAKESDKHTGGDVRYQNVLTLDNNLVPDKSLLDLINLFKDKGASMSKNSPEVVPFAARDKSQSAANDDAIRKAMQEAYTNGQGPVAPCDAVYRVWTQEEKSKLFDVMDTIFS